MGIGDQYIIEGRLDRSTSDGMERERWQRQQDEKQLYDGSGSHEEHVIVNNNEPAMKKRKTQRVVSLSESSSEEEIEVNKGKTNVAELEHTTEIAADDGTQIVAFEGGHCMLSNVRWTTIEEDGKQYNTVLQYVLAHLATYFKNKEQLRQIMSARTAKEQVDAAKKIDGYGGVEWKKMENKYMRRCLVLKFHQHPKLMAALKKTGTAVIANCNSYDREWGTGTTLTDSRTSDMKTWPGQNKLGRLLMKIRDEK
jgi:ribA/ribD-fused uncharacterized protein